MRAFASLALPICCIRDAGLSAAVPGRDTTAPQPRASAGLDQGSLAPTLFGWGITGHVVADLCVLLRLQYKAERPVLVQYYRYGTTGTVLHLPVPGYWYDYTVYSTDYQYKYY